MKIKVTDANVNTIQNALDHVQAKCHERCLHPKFVFALADYGEEQLDLHDVPKKYRKGATVESGRTSMPGGYGFSFTETMARVERSSTGHWFLVAIERRKGWSQVAKKLTLPQLSISLEAQLYMAFGHPLLSKKTKAILESLNLRDKIKDKAKALSGT